MLFVLMRVLDVGFNSGSVRGARFGAHEYAAGRVFRGLNALLWSAFLAGSFRASRKR